MIDAGLNIGACRCSDWAPDSSSLDEVWAWRLLDGLGRKDAVEMLNINPSTFTEALQYAKGRCFLHYLGVLVDYLISDAAKSNFAAAAGFFDLLTLKMPNPSVKVGVNDTELAEAGQIVSDKQSFYEADEDIFGSFKNMYLSYLSKA